MGDGLPTQRSLEPHRAAVGGRCRCCLRYRKLLCVLHWHRQKKQWRHVHVRQPWGLTWHDRRCCASADDWQWRRHGLLPAEAARPVCPCLPCHQIWSLQKNWRGGAAGVPRRLRRCRLAVQGVRAALSRPPAAAAAAAVAAAASPVAAAVICPAAAAAAELARFWAARATPGCSAAAAALQPLLRPARPLHASCGALVGRFQRHRCRLQLPAVARGAGQHGCGLERARVQMVVQALLSGRWGLEAEYDRNAGLYAA